jgi:predicted membrane-bound dolichyl-phosphate-mannose-protein mannosyltransferase
MFVLKGHNVIIYSCAEYLSINKTLNLFWVENFHPIMCVHAGSLGTFYFKKKNGQDNQYKQKKTLKF